MMARDRMWCFSALLGLRLAMAWAAPSVLAAAEPQPSAVGVVAAPGTESGASAAPSPGAEPAQSGEPAKPTEPAAASVPDAAAEPAPATAPVPAAGPTESIQDAQAGKAASPLAGSRAGRVAVQVVAGTGLGLASAWLGFVVGCRAEQALQPDGYDCIAGLPVWMGVGGSVGSALGVYLVGQAAGLDGGLALPILLSLAGGMVPVLVMESVGVDGAATLPLFAPIGMIGGSLVGYRISQLTRQQSATARSTPQAFRISVLPVVGLQTTGLVVSGRF